MAARHRCGYYWKTRRDHFPTVQHKAEHEAERRREFQRPVCTREHQEAAARAAGNHCGKRSRGNGKAAWTHEGGIGDFLSPKYSQQCSASPIHQRDAVLPYITIENRLAESAQNCYDKQVRCVDMGKKKRVNPRRIPMPKRSFDREGIFNEASSGNLYFAWLLVLHAMLEYEAETPEERQRFLDAANQTIIRENISNWRLMEASKLMGYDQPYPTLGFRDARSEPELAAYKRKARQNALHTALASICIGMDETEQIDRICLRRIFSNVALTVAEIESGHSSYDELAKAVSSYGLSVDETDEDVLVTTLEK